MSTYEFLPFIKKIISHFFLWNSMLQLTPQIYFLYHMKVARLAETCCNEWWVISAGDKFKSWNGSYF